MFLHCVAALRDEEKKLGRRNKGIAPRERPIFTTCAPCGGVYSGDRFYARAQKIPRRRPPCHSLAAETQSKSTSPPCFRSSAPLSIVDGRLPCLAFELRVAKISKIFENPRIRGREASAHGPEDPSGFSGPEGVSPPDPPRQRHHKDARRQPRVLVILRAAASEKGSSHSENQGFPWS